MIKDIVLKDVKDAEVLNLYATQFYYDTYVHVRNKAIMVDAKSLLGLISLVGQDNLIYVVPDDVDPKQAFRGLKKFAA